jgi:hypothetical protein
LYNSESPHKGIYTRNLSPKINRKIYVQNQRIGIEMEQKRKREKERKGYKKRKLKKIKIQINNQGNSQRSREIERIVKCL